MCGAKHKLSTKRDFTCSLIKQVKVPMHFMLISLLVSVMSHQYGPDLIMDYANEVFYAITSGPMFRVYTCTCIYNIRIDTPSRQFGCAYLRL